MSDKAYLLLADGTLFEGRAFGARVNSEGEVVFTTAMTGYQEALTDPGYQGEIICQTFPAIGNCGVNGEDAESARVWARGYVVREWCERPSNFRCEGDLDGYLRAGGVPGICGIDTRALTRRLRRGGTMNGAILQSAPKDIPAAAKALLGGSHLADAVATVSTKEPRHLPLAGATKHVAVYDFGAKRSILHQLTQRGCAVTLLPYNTPADAVLALKPDGVLLSNGPGDPAALDGAATTAIATLLQTLPVMGICLGHQVLARTLGAATHKLPFGHRGANQPVKELASGRICITSQNHGYTVSTEGLAGARVSHVNANDGTVEGLEYPGHRAFSVQFHPEAGGGPQGTGHLFDRFMALMA